MVLISDLTPIALCIATQQLLDTKRFREGFCDNLLLRMKESQLNSDLFLLKRKLNLPTRKDYLPGYKAIIISNIDKILFFISSYYSKLDYNTVKTIVKDGKEFIQKVLASESFEALSELEDDFKSKITLPTYQLFLRYMKGRKYE